MAPDGDVEEAEVPIEVVSTGHAAFDCWDGALTAVIAGDGDSSTRATVAGPFDGGAIASKERIPRAWTISMPRSSGIAGGAGYTVHRDGTYQRIPLQPGGRVTTGRFDIGEATVRSVAFDGASIVVTYGGDSESSE